MATTRTTCNGLLTLMLEVSTPQGPTKPQFESSLEAKYPGVRCVENIYGSRVSAIEWKPAFLLIRKEWVVWRMSGHVRLKELQHWSTAHPKRMTGATMYAIVGPMRKAREDNRNRHVSLIFNPP